MAERTGQTTRRSVLERARSGDGSEFSRFYLPIAFSMALSQLRDENDAADIAQETMIHLLKAVREMGFTYDPDGSFRGFVKTVVTRRVLDAVRKRWPKLDSEAVQREPAREPGPAEILEQEYERSRMKILLTMALSQVSRRVNPSTYQSFQLYCLEGWPVEEVCRQLRLTRDQVYTNKRRVLKLLRECCARLEREDI